MEKLFGQLPCKLTTRALIALEQDLGRNPLNALSEEEIPQLGFLLKIVYHGCRALDKTIKFDDIIDEFDNSNIGYQGLTEFVMGLYEASGLIKAPEASEAAPEGPDAAPKN